MNLLKRIGLIFSALPFCVIFLSACTVGSKLLRVGIPNLHYVRWVCKEAGIVLRQVVNYGSGYGYAEKDGKIEPLSFVFTPTYGYPGDCMIRMERPIASDVSELIGNVFVEADDPVDPHILRSVYLQTTLFSEEYENISFVQDDLDPATVDAMEYLNTEWHDENGLLSFEIGGGDCFGSRSNAFVCSEGEKRLGFSWLLDRKFEIRDWEQGDVLAQGTYENQTLGAELHFTFNLLFDGVENMRLFANPKEILL